MILYRTAKIEHAGDLSGTGARIYGGRWNSKGVGAIYTSMSKSLAILEFYIHINRSVLPKGFAIASIEVPDTSSVREIDINRLPKEWREYPAPYDLSAIGDEWARSGNTLLLRIPSAIVPSEWNILINPAHREIERVRIVEMEELDARFLLRNDER